MRDKICEMMEKEGCTGKRVTKELIDSRIESVDYQTVVIAGQKMMFCGIRMKGGFVVVGKPAACMDPSNWRDSIGQEISYSNSYNELWKLEAYHMMYAEVGPQPENSFEGFTAVNDNGTVKHIAQIGSFHRDLITVMQSSGYVAGETLQAYVKLEGYGKFTTNEPTVYPTDYLVIMDSNPDDKYVCPSEVMKAKKLV